MDRCLAWQKTSISCARLRLLCRDCCCSQPLLCFFSSWLILTMPPFPLVFRMLGGSDSSSQAPTLTRCQQAWSTAVWLAFPQALSRPPGPELIVATWYGKFFEVLSILSWDYGHVSACWDLCLPDPKVFYHMNRNVWLSWCLVSNMTDIWFYCILKIFWVCTLPYQTDLTLINSSS